MFTYIFAFQITLIAYMLIGIAGSAIEERKKNKQNKK